MSSIVHSTFVCSLNFALQSEDRLKKKEKQEKKKRKLRQKKSTEGGPFPNEQRGMVRAFEDPYEAYRLIAHMLEVKQQRNTSIST